MFFWEKHKTITNYYEMFARNVCERYQLTQPANKKSRLK